MDLASSLSRLLDRIALLVVIALAAGCTGDPPLERAVSGLSAPLAVSPCRHSVVPYVNQRAYDHYGESAFGPTSLCMVLQALFPNARVDVPMVYGAGLQNYTYHGPAIGLRLGGFAFVTADPDEDPRTLAPGFGGYY